MAAEFCFGKPALVNRGYDCCGKPQGCTNLKLVSNLPYAVATPVISNFLLSELPFERMVVTVQWEIAERLLAAPDSKEYGALAVLVQRHYRVVAEAMRVAIVVRVTDEAVAPAAQKTESVQSTDP